MAIRKATFTTIAPKRLGRRKQNITKRCTECGAKITTAVCIGCEMERKRKVKQ